MSLMLVIAIANPIAKGIPQDIGAKRSLAVSGALTVVNVYSSALFKTMPIPIRAIQLMATATARTTSLMHRFTTSISDGSSAQAATLRTPRYSRLNIRPPFPPPQSRQRLVQAAGAEAL